MALSLPKTLQALVTQDSAITRGFHNVKTAVDPLLQLCNSSFAVAQDGSMSFLRRVRLFAADTLTASTVNATTVNAGVSNVTGTSSANSVVSSAGFKLRVDLGVAWISNATANIYYRTKKFSQNQEANNTYNAGMLFQTPFAGSLVAIETFSSGTVGGTATVGIWQDVSPGVNAPVSAPNITYSGVSCGQFYGSYTSFAKGAKPVASGDYFQTGVSFTTAGNQHMQVNLWFEIGA